MSLVTDAIRRLTESSSAADGDVAIVRAWLDGKSTAGVAMSGADLEGILECVEAAGGLLADFDAEAASGPSNSRSSWRVRAQRIRRAQFWAHAFEPSKPLPAPPTEATSLSVPTDAIRELLEYVESEAIGRDIGGYRAPYLEQTALVRAWLDVATSGALHRTPPD